MTMCAHASSSMCASGLGDLGERRARPSGVHARRAHVHE
ncbi:hypothetical protein AKJ09_05770 [Labilithrix luteola]|uniref:Uncharacterized protein n=1 Tax=Labilithrix luteola TaxID=1391654 RepID=A0A0K1Q0C9_9BACT|nr:hypothetical protein AKJ09_05770 [Labilithrix luteola]